MRSVVIRASGGAWWSSLLEAWRHKEVLGFLVWRDLKVRYAQTAIGGAWAVLQPLLLMLVFSVFFGRLAKLPSNGVPYPVFAYTALVPWTLFSQSLSSASSSVVDNNTLVSKVYVPRILIPIAAAASFLVDFLLAILLVFGLTFYYGIALTPKALLVVPFGLATFLAALAAGIWLAAVNVKYRDVRFAIPFLIQLWLFLSPIVYASSLVPPRYRTLYFLNPMAGLIDGFRWSILSAQPPAALSFVASLAVLVGAIVGALAYFSRSERAFADVI